MTVPLGPDLSDGGPPVHCALCTRPMAADQEWCLECGAARTVIARAPNWRIPALAVAAVVLLIAAAVTVTMLELGHNAGRVTVVDPASPKHHQSGAKLGSWAPGLDGWTVILAVTSSRTAADAQARQLISGHVAHVGVLATDQHPQMRPPGVWKVYSGRYPSYALASSAAAKAAAHGQPQARASVVQRPGGG